MIIFDLDGTLADCEHRRHYVDKKLNADNEKWKPNWKAFFEACDKDKPIEPIIDQWNIQIGLGMSGVHQIWSGRCESVREKTEKWLNQNLICFYPSQLKMRPEGDNTPDDRLKERWLNERCSDLMEATLEGKIPVNHGIDYVFDDRPKVIRMWRRRGIFVFNCCQHEREF